MRQPRHCRSLLSTAASDTGRYAKAHRAGADLCVVDLEDAVPVPRKEQARSQAAGFFEARSAAATRCGVRINAVTEPDGLRDLLAIPTFAVRPCVVVVPKVESGRDLEIVERVLTASCPELALFAVVETPRALEHLDAIARGTGRLRGLIFGAADYSMATGARLSWHSLLYARSRVVNSARAAGIEALDAPTFDLSNPRAVHRESVLARDLGFSGKVAIHPSQVPVINAAFTPDTGLLQQARRVVAAGEANGRGIALLDGMMVGPPFFQAAQRLVEEYGPHPESSRPANAEG
jgi:citrate lyase subunit beta/citryl-CoA lyase/(S)-citramalyl-CoA lyase